MTRYTLLVVTMLAACSADPRVAEIEAIAGDAVTGEPLYIDNCSTCHGVDGLGGTVDHAIVESSDGHGHSHGDGQIIRRILNGGGGMPAFDSLSNQEIADIIAHLHELEDGAP